MLFEYLGKHSYVIKLNELNEEGQASKYPLYQTSKDKRGVDHSKWQDSPLQQATDWDGESSLIPVFLCVAYLMKTAL